MKRLLTICALSALLCSPCEAQLKMIDIYSQMPDSLFPYLSESNRLDFIDFLDSNMKAEVTNELDGKSEMLSFDDESLTLQLNSSTKVSMRLMPVKEPVHSQSQVVCVITTYGKDAPESKIEVYSTDWCLLDQAKYLNLPQSPFVAEFLPLSAGVLLKETNALDPIANEEQEETEPWLKNIEWKP